MLFSEFLEKQAAGAMSRIKNLDIVSDIQNVINRLSPAPHVDYGDLPNVNSMRFADLSTGVKGRLQAAASKLPARELDDLPPWKRSRMYYGPNGPMPWKSSGRKLVAGKWGFDEYKRALTGNDYGKKTGYDRRNDFFDLYKKYLERASAQDPKLSRIVRRTKQLKSRRDSLAQAKVDEEQIQSELRNQASSLLGKYNILGNRKDIPTLTVYEANTAFPTTHHLANADLSRRATRLAAEADDSVEFIPSVPGTGYMDHRNPFHRIHRPGQERTMDDVLAARANPRIGSSNEYEATFGKLQVPNAKVVYSRLTPDAQSFLGVTDDQIAHYAPDLQSLSRMVLYRGKRDGSTMSPVSKLALVARKTAEGLSDLMPSKYAEQLTNSIAVNDPTLRWYTPWSHMGSGYAVGEEAALTTPWVRLNAEQIAKLRNLYKQDAENTHAAADNIANTIKDTINNSPNRQAIINNARIDYLNRQIEEQLAKTVREGKLPNTLYQTI